MKHAVAFMLALMVPAASGENSTLFQAIRNGDVPTVKRHLTKAEVNATDPRGVTPLMHAAAVGNIETLRVLLDAGAEVNAPIGWMRRLFFGPPEMRRGSTPDRARRRRGHSIKAGLDAFDGRGVAAWKLPSGRINSVQRHRRPLQKTGWETPR